MIKGKTFFTLSLNDGSINLFCYILLDHRVRVLEVVDF